MGISNEETELERDLETALDSLKMDTRQQLKSSGEDRKVALS